MSNEEAGSEKPVSAGSSFPWAGLALYALGIVTGLLLLGIYTVVSGGALFGRTGSSEGTDVVAMRSAARDGTLDAIATLQAQSSQPPTPAATPTQVPASAFDVRPANRLGDPNAPVVMFEFSDFQ